jgi:hypothetical protein
MPKAARDILLGISVEQAIRKRKCGREKSHLILAGATCLVINAMGKGEKSYCASCAEMIVEAANAKLQSLSIALRQDVT